MMEIYLPVKFEFDWTNCFRVRVQKRKCGWMDVGHINLRGGLVTRNPPKKHLTSSTVPGNLVSNIPMVLPYNVSYHSSWKSSGKVVSMGGWKLYILVAQYRVLETIGQLPNQPIKGRAEIQTWSVRSGRLACCHCITMPSF